MPISTYKAISSKHRFDNSLIARNEVEGMASLFISSAILIMRKLVVGDLGRFRKHGGKKNVRKGMVRRAVFFLSRVDHPLHRSGRAAAAAASH